MPSTSWVAKWNNLEGMAPGIYAINILDDSPFEQENNYYPSARKKSRDKHHNEPLYSDDEEGYYQ